MAHPIGPAGWIVTSAALINALGAAAEPVIPIYQVDFDVPLHHLGRPPTLGYGPLPRATVSGFVESPVVVHGQGDLTRQSLLFEFEEDVNGFGLEQLKLEIPAPLLKAAYFAVEFDIHVETIRTARRSWPTRCCVRPIASRHRVFWT